MINLEPKPLPFKEGDYVQLFYIVPYLTDFFTIKGRVHQITDTLVWVTKPESRTEHTPILRDLVFTTFDEAKDALIGMISRRIKKELDKMERVDSKTEASEYRP